MTMSKYHANDRAPICIHFGCGRLGIGGVLPYLITKLGATHAVVAIQRADRWKGAPDSGFTVLRTSAKDFMPFYCLRSQSALFEYGLLDQVISECRRVLILVPDLWSSGSILRRLLANHSPNVIISSSLGEGQSELAAMLRITPSWERLLAFENTLSSELSDLDSDKTKVHQIFLDRICWDLSLFCDNGTVVCHCESAASTRIRRPAGCLELGETPLPPQNEILGERVMRGWKEDTVFEDTKVEKRLQLLQKRALVNGPHAVTAQLCVRLIAERDMSVGDSYLAPLQRMLQLERPEWCDSLDHYLRLRAVQVAWEQIQELNDLGSNLTEVLHARFAIAYHRAIESSSRFFATNDRLERLMSATKFHKELSKFEEHIVRPLKFFQDAHDLKKHWIYGRPNLLDLDCLQDFLTETFFAASKRLTNRQ